MCHSINWCQIRLTYFESIGHISWVMGVVEEEIDCSMQTFKFSCFGFSSWKSTKHASVIPVMTWNLVRVQNMDILTSSMVAGLESSERFRSEGELILPVLLVVEKFEGWSGLRLTYEDWWWWLWWTSKLNWRSSEIMVEDSHLMRMAKPPSSKLLTSCYWSTTYKGERTRSRVAELIGSLALVEVLPDHKQRQQK